LNTSNQRRAQRIDVDLRVTVTLNSKVLPAYPLPGRLENLSVDGMRISFPFHVDILDSDHLHIALNLPEPFGSIRGRGDVVVLTEMEHHANIVPWHMLAAERGVELRWLPIDDDGQLVLDDLDTVLDGAKLLSIFPQPNIFGNPKAVADWEAWPPGPEAERT